MEPIKIIDRGRGPELAGTRVTVFDIIPYLQRGRHPTYIAAEFDLGTEEVLALIRYIEDHKEAVMEVNRKIEERISKGNPPEVERLLAASPTRARIQAIKAEYRRKHPESDTTQEGGSGACDHGGR